MKRTFLTLLSLVCIVGTVVARTQSDSLLRVLDRTIKERVVYAEKKDSRISELNKLLRRSTQDEQRYIICSELFDEFRAYNTDSSLYYATEKLRLAKRLGKPEYLDDARMNTAEVMGTTGMYKESLDILNSIHHNVLAEYLRPYYYHLYRNIYGLMCDYSVTEKEKTEYARITDLYRDSLLMVNSPKSTSYIIVKADQLMVRGKYNDALQILLTNYNKLKLNAHETALLSYGISEAYRALDDREKEKYFLSISAIYDLRSAVKEYVSLRKLASLLYEDGDIDRAYDFLKCSMEDATRCNARLRTIEISQVFPIIDKAYQQKTMRQKNELMISLICISILSVFLILAIIYVYRQMKRLAEARRKLYNANTSLNDLNSELKKLNEKLHQSNTRLKEMNLTLSETNYIKEEYIGRYMDQCSAYLDKMDNYRRRLGKIASSGKVDDLYKAIKSSQFIEDELRDFYESFDDTFLHLYPNFVEEFNALLSEKIILKSGELLNTELRIFALIRLGITDSVKIAHFLRYSVTTIYNYRTKMRNKSIGERDQFESRIMQIGTMSE